VQIKKIDVFPMEYPESNDNMSVRSIVVVRLEASDGTVGWGECISIFHEATASITALIRHGVGDVVLDKDPYDIEAIWEALRDKVWWYGNVGGIAALAISAIDMALWDLKGKLLKLNLSQMLGGKLRERLPACASSHPKAATIDDMALELAAHIQNGYQYVKVGFGKKGHANLGVGQARDDSFVKAVRSAIGEKAGFIIDVGAKCKWDIPRAVSTAKAMSEYQLAWIEDPFFPDNFNAYHHLRSAVPEMRVGFGERFFNLQDYGRLLDADVCDVILVDPGRVEGITGMWKIFRRAAERNVAVNAHTWAGALNTAASIHLSLCATNPILFELKPAPGIVQHELVTNPVEQREGWVYAPEGYGLGADVIEDTVRKYTIEI